MDHRVVEKAEALQANFHGAESSSPLSPNCQGGPPSCTGQAEEQVTATASNVACREDAAKMRVRASLSSEVSSGGGECLGPTSSTANKPTSENPEHLRDPCPLQIPAHTRIEGSSSESSSTSDTITQSAPAILGTVDRTSASGFALASSRAGGNVGVGQGCSSDDSVSEGVTELEEPSNVGSDTMLTTASLLSNAQEIPGDVNRVVDSQEQPLTGQTERQRLNESDEVDLSIEGNNKDVKPKGGAQATNVHPNSGQSSCGNEDENANGVLVFGPCGEWRRWPHSRRVSIEKRPEGFGFTLRNVVAYPSHIHKIATSLGKRPKDVEPWWAEGKPLDAVVVREVRECGAAQAAGLRPHDRIVAHRGSPIESYAKFVAHIHQCSSVLELVVVSVLDDPLLRSGLLSTGAGGGMCSLLSGSLSRSVASCPAPSLGSTDPTGGPGLTSAGIGSGPDVVPMQRSHWLSSSLAPRPYLSSYPRGTTSAVVGPYFRSEEQRQQQLKSLQLVHSSPINQSTVSLTESVTTGGSVSGAESEMSLSLPSIPLTTSTPPLPPSSSSTVPSSAGPMPPSASVPIHLAAGKGETHWRLPVERGAVAIRREQKKKKMKTKKDKRESAGLAETHREEGSRSSSLGSLDPPSPGLPVSVAAKLQLFESGGQGFLARSMEKLKLYRSELTRMASPPPNTVQARTAQFEKSGAASAHNTSTDEATAQTTSREINKKVSTNEDVRGAWQSSTVKGDKVGSGGDKKSGTTSPPPGVSLKKLRTLFSDKTSMSNVGSGCALKILRCPDNGKRLDHSWRPAGVHMEKAANGNPVLRIVTDKESINVIVNRLLSDLASGGSVHVSLASPELAKRRKNVLHFIVGGTASVGNADPLAGCEFCVQQGKIPTSNSLTDAGYEFLVQCDSSVTVHNICSVMHTVSNDGSGVLHIGPSVIERAAAFDRRFLKNHQLPCAMGSWAHSADGTQHQTTSGGSTKPAEVIAPRRSKSRRASMGDEPSLLIGSRAGTAGSTAVHRSARGMSIGVPLESCPPSADNPLVPWLVAHCCSIIETRGLDVLGIYRVPGNSAAVQQLTATVNNLNSSRDRSGTGAPGNVKLDDPRWTDVNVVSSLLKSFFRLLPEPLLTGTLYQHFIAADKITDCRHRLAVLQSLVHKLPPSHSGTLQFFCAHLQRVASRAETNKMDSRNLSIVLGPTLVRSGSGAGVAQSSMLSMISDMRHQCHLTETFVNYSDYLFTREDPMSTSTISTLEDMKPLLSSSSEESVAVVDSSLNACPGLSTKLSLLPGTPAPALSVKQKIHSFECGKPPVLEESALCGNPTASYILSKAEESASAASSAGASASVATIDNSGSAIPPTPSKIASQYKRQIHKDRHRQRSTIGHELGRGDTIGPTEMSEACNNPMSLSYHERRVLAAEKAKVFEEETRAVLEKKAFRSQGIASGAGGGIQEQRMNREQTERRWQEVKRQATLLTRDNSDDNIDKENHSSQNKVESISGFCNAGSSSVVSSMAVTAIEARPPEGVKCDPAGEDAVSTEHHRRNADERSLVGKSSTITASGVSGKGVDEEVVMLRARSGRSLGHQQSANRGNRNGVVYSPNSSKILKSIVQLDDRGSRGGAEGGGAQRKKSRLERRHTIAGSHSHHPLLGSGTIMSMGEKTLLSRTPSERKPRERPSRHRATT